MDYTSTNPRTDFLDTKSPQFLLGINVAAALVYFALLVTYFPPGHRVLYSLLVIGQIFHLWQLVTYIYTVWDTSYEPPKQPVTASVDIFITVAGEPVEIVEETVRGALAMDYPQKQIYILNDGFVAKKENWRDAEALAARLGVQCITRTTPGGAKAGNINNALRQTNGELVAIFDADHVPHADFLRKTTPYFADEKMGYVQTPQYYKNYDDTYVTRSAWEQQELFFGPICKGKNRLNAATMCGTNMLIRRTAIVEAGGMCEESIAEDFVTGMFIHERGWKSYYLPEVLAEGLAPHELESYYKQQFRWARGALDVMFRYNPLLRSGLSWPQKIQYLASSSFYLSGLIVLMHATLPLLFLFFGIVPIEVSGMILASVFLPYMFLTLYTLQLSSNFSYTFHSFAFSMAAFNVHISAFLAAVTGRRSAFSITPKTRSSGTYVRFVTPQLAYLAIAASGMVYAIMREGLSASVVNNGAWVLFNAVVFLTFVRAAFPETGKARVTDPVPADMHAPHAMKI